VFSIWDLLYIIIAGMLRESEALVVDIFYLGGCKVGSHHPSYEGRKVAERGVGE